MAHALHIAKDASKEDIYREILPQIKSLIEGETDLTANLANVAAALHEAFRPLWTGFYVRQGDQLVLGPFQGPIACTRIPLAPVARGVCGAAAKQRKTLVVPDVDKFPGHIACSSASRSEIVVPGIVNGQAVFVLDIDSTDFDTFDEIDAKYLEQVVTLILQTNFKG